MARKRRKSTRTSEEGSRMPGWNSRCVSEREREAAAAAGKEARKILSLKVDCDGNTGLSLMTREIERGSWATVERSCTRRERERVSERVSEDTHTSRLPVCVAQDLRDSKRARKREQREQNENSCVDARQAESAGEREEQREGQQKGD